MTNQKTQVDALEHLLLAVIRASRPGLSQGRVFELAKKGVMNDGGPLEADEKVNAVHYLEQLFLQLKQE